MTQVPNGFTKKRLLAALFCFPLTVSASIDWDALKRDVVEYCQREPSKDLSVRCMVEAGRKVSTLDDALNSDSGPRIVSQCARWSSASENPSYHLLNCVAIHYPLLISSPNPLWADLNLRRNEFRAEWVSRCFASVGPAVSDCVAKQEAGFSLFWNDYTNLAPGDSVGSNRIGSCVGRNLSQYDFSKYAHCRKH